MYKRYARDEDEADETAYYGRNVRPRYDEVGGRVSSDRYMPAGPFERDFRFSEADEKKAQEVKAAREPIVARSAFTGTIKGKGRGPPVMQQAMIVSTVRMGHEEAKRRARTPPELMLVPNSLSPGMERVFQAMPGDVLLEECDSKSAADRRKIGSYGSREVFAALNGLRRDAVTRVAGVMAAKTSDPSNPYTDDAHVNEEAGSTTIMLNGPEEIYSGDDVFADDLPYYKMGPGDRPVSVVQNPGQPIEKLMPAIYAVRNTDVEAALAEARLEINQICTDAKNDTWAKRWTAATARFDEIDARFGRTQSLKSYALLYLVMRSRDHNASVGNELDALVAVIKEDLLCPDIAEHQSFFGSVAGTPDDQLFATAAAANNGSVIIEVLARSMQRAQDSYRDRLRRKRLGKCIKGGKPGQPIDIILGVHSLV